jgi:hypothetical protein
MRQRTADICAFAIIVGTPAALIALNLPSDQVIASTSAAAVLYSAWRQGGGTPPSQGSGGRHGADSAAASDSGAVSESETRPGRGPSEQVGSRDPGIVPMSLRLA